jgi:hypothetical protein
MTAPATDTRPAPDLAALRTSLRVEVERVCNGAEWEPAIHVSGRDKVFRRRNGEIAADTRPEIPGAVRFWEADPTSDIGAAMALVDQLQAEGWVIGSRQFLDALLEMRFAVCPVHAAGGSTWWLMHCPPALRPLVLTIAVLAARGADWRRFLTLLKVDNA